jgi:integrase/recombinase XerD
MNKEWTETAEEFKYYLTIERSLSENTILAYLGDITHFAEFMTDQYPPAGPADTTADHIRQFLKELKTENKRSVSRMISGIRSFFSYLVTEGKIAENPAALIDSPQAGMILPDVLTTVEIDRIEAEIDLSSPSGHRNRAIIETLYGCGLRVSELVNLRLTDLHFRDGFITVTGKGDKQRLVPVNSGTIREISFYMTIRNSMPVIKDPNILFLNRRGRKLSREMIYTIIKELTRKAGITKRVSPHTFRHSFATHLVQAGADLRAVQEMLGHESILTTEIYTHIDRIYLRDEILEHHPRGSRHLKK